MYFSTRFMVRVLGCWQCWVNKFVVYSREILVGWNPTDEFTIAVLENKIRVF
ncbi:MAG: hypothetical protein AAGI69_08160 [Cyanobacteria bacterium P01_H01_bin.21]